MTTGFKLVTADELTALHLPPRQMLLAPWLPEKALAMVYAARGVGKTFFALSAAHAVATGGTFLGWSAPCPRNVVYVDGEMPAELLQKRLQLLYPDGASAPKLRFLAHDLQPKQLPDLGSAAGQAEYLALLDEADLVIFDNLSTLIRTGRENEAESWGATQAFALDLRRRGKSVLFVHHAGKAGGQRGTSRREDALDVVIALSHTGDYDTAQGARFTVEFEKTREFLGAGAALLEAALDPDTGAWTTRPPPTPRKDEIEAMISSGMNQAQVARHLGVHRSTVSRELRSARA